MNLSYTFTTLRHLGRSVHYIGSFVTHNSLRSFLNLIERLNFAKISSGPRNLDVVCRRDLAHRCVLELPSELPSHLRSAILQHSSHFIFALLPDLCIPRRRGTMQLLSPLLCAHFTSLCIPGRGITARRRRPRSAVDDYKGQ